MKKNMTRKTDLPHPRAARQPKPAPAASLWAEVHPKPPLPIDHPIPRLTPRERRGRRGEGRGRNRPAAVDYLSTLLCAWLLLAMLAGGCTGIRPLKGGKAAVVRKRSGEVEQTLVQGENAAQPTRQDQQSTKVRTYTVPAGSRLEEASVVTVAPGRMLTNRHAVVVSAPMAVVEQESTRALAEIGAAQKDTARELGARLASLKSIVWVGAGLFVFGLASLAWPPLKAIVGSVTTSGALMLGGLALVILPSLVVGHEALILGVVALAVGAWCLSYRHGNLRGKAESRKQKVESRNEKRLPAHHASPVLRSSTAEGGPIKPSRIANRKS
jgi:hypothetical protein